MLFISFGKKQGIVVRLFEKLLIQTKIIIPVSIGIFYLILIFASVLQRLKQ